MPSRPSLQAWAKASNRELLAASLAARAAASSRSMKISANMACLPGLPLPFVGGVALAVQTVGVSERYVPSCCTEQTSAPPRNWMAYGLSTYGWCGSHNGRYGMSSRYPWSVDFGAGELDHLGPLLCICGDECAEVGGRACKHRVAEVGDPRLHAGISEARVDLFVEL